jgi:hypothetical protein
MALFQLPLLKEFRARDVQFDARDLIRKGEWVCNGLEVLDFSVWISREWGWCSSHGRWTARTHCESNFRGRDECQFEVEDESEDEMKIVTVMSIVRRSGSGRIQ